MSHSRLKEMLRQQKRPEHSGSSPSRLQTDEPTQSPRTAAASPILYLLPELLAHIFSFCALDAASPPSSRRPSSLPESKLAWVVVTHICRRWRQVALDYPLLWSNIVFDLGPSWAIEMLARARNSGVVFDLRLPYITAKEGRWARNLLVAHLHHTTTVTLRGSASEVDAVAELLSTPAPALEELRIEPDHYVFGEIPMALPPTLFAGKTPHLRSVFVRYCALPWPFPALGEGLSSFGMWLPDPFSPFESHRVQCPSLSHLLDTLERMPNLETLHLANCLPDTRADSYSPQAVELPRIAWLGLEGPAVDCRNLLSHVSIPSTAQLSIRARLASSDDLRPLIAFVSAHYAARGRPLHALDVEGTSSAFAGLELRVRAWEDRSPEPEPALSFSLSWEHAGVLDPLDAMRRVCGALPLDALRTLAVAVDGAKWTAQTWVETFGRCARVERIRTASPLEVRTLAAALVGAAPRQDGAALPPTCVDAKSRVFGVGGAGVGVVMEEPLLDLQLQQAFEASAWGLERTTGGFRVVRTVTADC
ncbi:hypothetical protein OF83DRAFT_1083745 [Amylostereum chailletii]|nr:hypothetical protein OF83DRAFT_1083745 [Amylostereum chailletii]